MGNILHIYVAFSEKLDFIIRNLPLSSRCPKCMYCMYSLFYSFLIYLSNMLSLLNVFYVSAKELSLQILHCITQYYAYQGIFWKPEKTSKFQSIHSTMKIWTDFHENKANFFFFWKKIQNGRFSKMAIFQNRQFSKFFRENFTDSFLGYSRIAWCKGHWSGSTYMVVRLSY